MELFLIVGLLVAILLQRRSHGQLREEWSRFLETRTGVDDERDEGVRLLTRRVYELEQELARARAGKAAEEPVVAAPVVEVREEPAAVVREEAGVAPVWAEQVAAAVPVEAFIQEEAPQEVFANAGTVSAAETLKQKLGGEEWEALVGGSILNKLGALVFIIGLVLFLGFSFTRMGPGGRVAVSLAVSGALLGGGVVLERRQGFQVFSYGLLGAGWAGLYVSVYAMHAVAAARVIENPVTGAMLLLLVGLGMVAHAMKYQSQALTGVAAASIYAALGLGEVKQLAVGGLVPVSAALLALAQRYRWHGLGLLGAVASYGIVVAKSQPGTPLGPAQAFLFVLWLVFEVFDVALEGQDEAPWYARVLYPLNGLAFVGLSYLKWEEMAAGRLHYFLAGVSVLYVVDAFVRGRRRAEGYRWSLAAAAAFAALAIVRQAGGPWAAVLLSCEAELLFFAGVRTKRKFVEVLGGLAFTAAVVRLGAEMVMGTIGGHGEIAILGWQLEAWTPAAVWVAGLCYVNRIWRTVPIPYTWAGSAIVHAVIGAEVKTAWLAAAWMGWTTVLTEAGLWLKAEDLRRQSYLAGASAVIALVFGPMAHLVKPGPAEQWMVLAICAVLAGVCAMRLWLVKRLTGASTVHAMGALGVLLVLSWAQLPEVSVVLAWMALALLTVEAGLAYEHPVWPVLGHAVATLGFGRLFVANFTNAGETAGISHRIVTVLPASAAFAQLWHRCREEASARLHLWAATAAVVILMRFELGRVYTIAGWAPLGVLLLVLGLRWKLADLRWQSYALAVGVAMRGLTTSFDEPSSMGGLMTRLAVAGCAIACLYVQEFLAPRLSKEDGREWLARPVYSVLASLLVALVLHREISGSVLTVAWGLEGVLLLAAGFPARERVLRVSGLAGLMVCILKLFFYDLRNLETLPRIFSFMVLGLLLLAVSWGYTRFQERLRRML